MSTLRDRVDAVTKQMEARSAEVLASLEPLEETPVTRGGNWADRLRARVRARQGVGKETKE